MDAVSVLELIAGIGVFLIACTMLSSNLESICSSKLRALFARASDKKLVGVGIGTVATAAIQSSGATTVLVIGFVNAGIMSLTLAAAVIYGANIGTTVTAQIVAWGMSGGSSSLLTAVFGAMAGVGAFMDAFSKNDRTKKIGLVIAAFGMLFVALGIMSSSMSEFAKDPAVTNFLAGLDNYLLLIIFGALLTALVQSSSVVTSVLIVMLMQGLIGLDQAIYLAMGSNIGSCIVAIIAGFTSGTNAKRTALMHLTFNVIGVVIFSIAGAIIGFTTGQTYGSMFEGMFPNIQIDLAMFHTFFNVVTVIIMLPLTGKLVAFVTKVIPDRPDVQDPDAPRLFYVDEHMLTTPGLALVGVKKEIVKMAETAMDNFSRSCRIISTQDFSEEEMFHKNEKQLNFTNKKLTKFLAKLTSEEISDKDSAYVATAFHSITDLERVGDYAVNIVGYAHKLKDSGEAFSETAVGEIEEARKTVESLYRKVMEAYEASDRSILKEAHVFEESIDEMTQKMADDHIARLAEGRCSPGAGAEYLAMASDIERIADHFYNVGKSVKTITPKPVKKTEV